MQPYTALLPTPPDDPQITQAQQALAGIMEAGKAALYKALTAFVDGFRALFDPETPDSIGAIVIHSLVTTLSGLVDAAFLFLEGVIVQLYNLAKASDAKSFDPTLHPS